MWKPSTCHPSIQLHLLNTLCSGAGRGWPKAKHGVCLQGPSDLGDIRASESSFSRALGAPRRGSQVCGSTETQGRADPFHCPPMTQPAQSHGRSGD